ncbi:MAG: hypothetical protein JWM82_2023 [Myxococcales bacterium]|nr:hypothetical protein [Myxococcales bacterium]
MRERRTTRAPGSGPPLVGVVLALVLGCGNGVVGAPRGGAPFEPSSSAASACATFTRAICSYLMQCRRVPYCDLDHCVADNDCGGFAELARAVNAGAVSYDASKVDACFARFAGAPCLFGSLSPAPNVFDVLSQCPGALGRRLERGARCVSTSECGAGLTCVAGALACSGTCAPVATAGQACGGDATCGPGLTCDAARICQRDGVVGSPCAGNADCGPTSPGLWCDPTTKTCKPGVASGAACGALAAALVACAPGLSCDAASTSTSGVCRPPPPPADLGGHCELASDCVAGLLCNYGVCGRRFDLGARCRYDDECQTGLTCAVEQCLELRCPGDSCADPNTSCVLGTCKNQRCQPRARLGGACDVGGDCTSGSCVAGACAAASVCEL